MSEIDSELTILICGMVAAGDTLKTIGEALGMAPSSVFTHVCKTEEGRALYAKARDAASDLLESEIIEACRNVTGKTAQADRVRIDGLKWVAARRCPKKYGDRVVVDNTSSDGSMTPKSIGATLDPRDAARMYADLMKE